MPHKANIKNGAGIDLNPGFAKAFGVAPPFMLQGVKWEWVVDSSAAHHKLFGRSVPDAMAVPKRPVPTRLEYPNDSAREYAQIAISKLRQTSGIRVGWPPFIEQGLRLVILERIKARRLPISLAMQMCLDSVRKSSEIMATIDRR